MLTASIIAVGNEILFGSVEDKLGSSLCRMFHSIGWTVSQLAVTQNDGIRRRSVRKGLGLDHVQMFIYGGVGPLHSDATLAGVAKAFGICTSPVEEFEKCLRYLISEKCTGDRNEMAQLPEGITELPQHKQLSVPLIKCHNVLVLSATNVAELELQWNCPIDLSSSTGLLVPMEPLQ